MNVNAHINLLFVNETHDVFVNVRGRFERAHRQLVVVRRDTVAQVYMCLGTKTKTCQRNTKNISYTMKIVQMWGRECPVDAVSPC
jgi:hypothetical protein